MKWLHWISRVLVAAVFGFSAIAKLYPIEPFELTLVDIDVASWSFAPYLARSIIGLELFLGVAVLLPISSSIKFLRGCLWLTLFFSVYLIALWVIRGNDVNCGCFGSTLAMTPLQSLIKNVVLIGIIWAAIRSEYDLKRRMAWIPVLLAFVCLVVPPVLNPPSFNPPISQNIDPYSFPENWFPDEVNNFIDTKENDQVLAFVSSSCSHCKVAAQKLGILLRDGKVSKVKLIVLGKEEEMNAFFLEANASFPYVMSDHPGVFKITKGRFPAVLRLNGDTIVEQWSGAEFSNMAIQKSF